MSEPDYPFLAQHHQGEDRSALTGMQSQAPAVINTAMPCVAWSNGEDQYLIDATLRGEGYNTMSLMIRSAVVRSPEECRNRIKQLSDPTVSGGVLPQLWEWPLKMVRQRRRMTGIGEIPFTDNERTELLMWHYYGRRGLDPLVFNDERCREELRDELRRLTVNIDPQILRTAVLYWRGEREAEWRRRSAREAA